MINPFEADLAFGAGQTQKNVLKNRVLDLFTPARVKPDPMNCVITQQRLALPVAPDFGCG